MAADGYVVSPGGTFTWINNIGGDQYDVIYSGEGFWEALINWVMGNGFTTSYSITISPEFMDSEKERPLEILNIEGVKVGEGVIHTYRLSDTEEASELFEFLANNTNVEWGHKVFKKTINGAIANVITTSHEDRRVSGLATLYDIYMGRRGYGYDKFILNNHSQPSNELPSGSDKDTHKNIVKFYNSPEVKSNIFFQNKYYEFDGDGLIRNRKKIR